MIDIAFASKTLVGIIAQWLPWLLTRVLIHFQTGKERILLLGLLHIFDATVGSV
jgi:hypothetical protein